MTRSQAEALNTLFVQTPGAYLALDHDSVLVTAKGNRTRLPLQRLDAIVLIGPVSASSELIARCADDGRPITSLSSTGRFRYRIEGPLSGNVLLRQAQHDTHRHLQRRARLAATIAAGKIKNSRRTLLSAGRNSPDVDTTQVLRDAAEAVTRQLPELAAIDDLDTIRGIEGRAARTYFAGLRAAVRQPETATGQGRTRRPPLDPLNALLSFGYGLLRLRCVGALESVGLDPQIGFLHGIRPGRPSLALDLMEELRPTFVDRLVLNTLNLRQLQARHFEAGLGGGIRLTDHGRRLFLELWQQYQGRPVNHPLLHTKVETALVPLIQAKLLARHLRGDIPVYLPYITRT